MRKRDSKEQGLLLRQVVTKQHDLFRMIFQVLKLLSVTSEHVFKDLEIIPNKPLICLEHLLKVLSIFKAINIIIIKLLRNGVLSPTETGTIHIKYHYVINMNKIINAVWCTSTVFHWRNWSFRSCRSQKARKHFLGNYRYYQISNNKRETVVY